MTNYATQQQNDDMVSLLAAYFRLLYNPVHSFADAVAILQMFPGSVGLWSMSATARSNPVCRDFSTNGLHLTRTAATFGVADLAPIASFDGSTAYLSHADATNFDIAGNEGHIAAGIRGLTIGGWFQFDRLATDEGLIGKLGSSGNRSYVIQKFSDNTINFRISSDGTALFSIPSAVVTTSQWYFIVGKFVPSTSIAITINGATSTNSTSIPASIFNSSAQFAIGAYDGGAIPTQPLDGQSSLCFLCSAAVPDIFINTFYQMTAPLFNVSI